MSKHQDRYSRSVFPLLVYCGNNTKAHHFVRDAEAWEEFTDSSVTSYLSDGKDMLIHTLTNFVDSKEPFNSVTAKELRFMLEALIEVKEIFTGSLLPEIRREG